MNKSPESKAELAAWTAVESLNAERRRFDRILKEEDAKTNAIARKFYEEVQPLVAGHLGGAMADFQAVIEKSKAWRSMVKAAHTRGESKAETAFIVKMTKRPLGFTFVVRGFTYTITRRPFGYIQYKRIA